MTIKSIQELIEMKQALADKKSEVNEMYVESLDSDIEYKVASRPEIVQARKLDDIDVDISLIFNNVIKPDLKNAQLQEVFNKGKKPYMIVDVLFTALEVGKLSLAIIGSKQPDLVKDLKN